MCVYAEEIENSGTIPYDQLYAQLCEELSQGRRYWFEDDDNERIMKQNEDFQQIINIEKMVELTFLPPEETPDNAKPIALQTIMATLEKRFPTFTIKKNTAVELGKKLTLMGFTHKKRANGSAFIMVENR